MTPEQFENWLALEGLEGAEFCDLIGKSTLSTLFALDDRWVLRHPEWVVTMKDGWIKRTSPARHLGNDVPGSWKTVGFADVPARVRDRLIKRAKEGA